MKFFLVLAVTVAVASAASLSPDANAASLSPDATAEVIRNENDNIGVGPFAYLFETSNGISARAQGAIADLGTENEGLEMVGEFEYPGPDGVIYKVAYTAGRNGFRPTGAHIPQA